MDSTHTSCYTRLHRIFACCVIALFSVCSASAQQPMKARQGQYSIENRKAQKEIEMMRKMLRERRAQQEQQRELLNELQNSISALEGRENQNAPVISSSTKALRQSTTPHYVTSGSTLSQIEAQERLAEEVRKHKIEMQIANNEIELLKKQLDIANRQLDNCQRGSSQLFPISTREYYDRGDNYQPVNSRTTPSSNTKLIKSVKPKKQKTRQTEWNKQTPKVAEQSQISEENRRALEEIEQMRSILRERRVQQEQQKQIIKELQKTIENN